MLVYKVLCAFGGLLDKTTLVDKNILFFPCVTQTSALE